MILLRLLAFALLLAVAVAGVSVLPWPLASSAVLIGVGIAVRRLRQPRESATGEVLPPEHGEAYRPRTRDPEWRA
jgi:hypothetical protein